MTWQNLILGAIGPLGVVAQQAIHTLLGADCRHLNAYSYGVVRVDPTAGTATITLKDSAGNELHDQLTPTTACTRTLRPSGRGHGAHGAGRDRHPPGPPDRPRHPAPAPAG